VLGPGQSADPLTTSLADWRRVFAVNVEGVFLGCRFGIQAMTRAGGGAIINMSSVAGLLATPFATAYGASKAAVVQLTKSVAQYCAEHGLQIRCNSVHPGIVRTPLWDHYAAEAANVRGVSFDRFLSDAKSTIPLGEFTGMEDVAATVAFLAADDSRFITGSKFIVDGGIVACDTFSTAAKRLR